MKRGSASIGREGRIVHEAARDRIDLGRALTTTPFLVAYRVQHETIEILGVLHGAQRGLDRL